MGGFYASLVVNGVTAAVVLVLFVLLRKRFAYFYSPLQTR